MPKPDPVRAAEASSRRFSLPLRRAVANVAT